MGIDYSGKQKLERPRKLVEAGTFEHYQDQVINDPFGTIDERDEFTDKLYSDLARTYLKGNVVKEAISKMDPAQSIPIEENADAVRAAAIRISREDSSNGTLITFNMFQKCVDSMLNKKWELRGTVITTDIPSSVYERTAQTNEKVSGSDGAGGWIKEFINQNGIVTTILGVLTMSPFQAPIFQALGVENASKGVQTAQIPLGITIFLELGIKADKIRLLLKQAKLATPAVDQYINELENSPSRRAQAFQDMGLDYTSFVKSQEFRDSELIINYVQEYYQRYGGLVAPNSHLTLDHWLGYLQVSQNQQIIRGALNTSSTFSPKFESIRNQYDPPLEGSENQNIYSERKKTSKMFNDFASVTRALNQNSNDFYDNIVNALSHRITDEEFCCLVQIFGAIGDPNAMLGLAAVLRIFASSLAADLGLIFDLMAKLLGNILQDSLFELMAQINKFYFKIAHKLAKAFTVDFENLPACSGMLALGWGLIRGLQELFNQINALLKEISSLIGDFGLSKNIKWDICAERRHILGLARILEVLAYRLEMANACALNRDQKIVNIEETIDNRQVYVDEAIFSIIQSKDPLITISPENMQKHFSNLSTATSNNLKFKYGITSQQNNETNTAKCHDPDQQARLQLLIKNITTALQESFNG